MSGENSYQNLQRLTTDVLAYAPSLFVFDNANDGAGGVHRRSVEAIIRRIWTAYPDCKIVFMQVFAVTDHDVDATVNTPTTAAMQAEFLALANHYGIPMIPVWENMAALVNATTYHLNELLRDTVHPTDLGFSLMFDWLEPVLTLPFLTTPQFSGTFPAYLYDDGSYEADPPP